MHQRPRWAVREEHVQEDVLEVVMAHANSIVKGHAKLSAPTTALPHAKPFAVMHVMLVTTSSIQWLGVLKQLGEN